MTDDRSKQELIAELAEAYRTLDEERAKKQQCSEAARVVIRNRVAALSERINTREVAILSQRDSLEQLRAEQEANIAERARLLAFLGEER